MDKSHQKIIQEGLKLYQDKKVHEALQLLEEKSALFAGVAAFFNLKGLCLSELNEHDEAVKCFVEAVKINPLDPMPYTNIGNSLAKNLQFEEADKYFDLALTVEPNHAEAAVGKGVAAFQRLDYPAAEAAFEQALILRPGMLVIETNLGNCYSVQGKYDQAMEYLDRSVEKDPDNGLARTNRGLIHLVRGNFEQGWKDYEYRFDSGNMVPNRFSNVPRWPGPNSPSSNVLIWAEQGLGDEIMFSTIFPDLEQLPHTFYVECDPRLYEIFKASFPRLHFVVKRSITAIDGIAYQLPLASLGLYFRNQIESFPRPDGGHLSKPSGKLSPETLISLEALPRPWTGVSWESYALTKNFRGRKSISAAEFSHLTRQLPGSVINLQFPNPHRHEKQTEQEIPEQVVTLPDLDLKNDVGALAELLGKLDRVVTIGNSVAHMCGGFGVPATVLLPEVPDWRWGHEKATSYWYASLTLNRERERFLREFPFHNQ
jgi:Flp pilus assembly protein TadD